MYSKCKQAVSFSNGGPYSSQLAVVYDVDLGIVAECFQGYLVTNLIYVLALVHYLISY